MLYITMYSMHTHVGPPTAQLWFTQQAQTHNIVFFCVWCCGVWFAALEMLVQHRITGLPVVNEADRVVSEHLAGSATFKLLMLMQPLSPQQAQLCNM